MSMLLIGVVLGAVLMYLAVRQGYVKIHRS